MRKSDIEEDMEQPHLLCADILTSEDSIQA